LILENEPRPSTPKSSAPSSPKNSIAEEEGTAAANEKSVNFVELETGEKEVPAAKQEESPKAEEMGRSRSSSTSSKSSKASKSSRSRSSSSASSSDEDEKITKIPIPTSPKSPVSAEAEPPSTKAVEPPAPEVVEAPAPEVVEAPAPEVVAAQAPEVVAVPAPSSTNDEPASDVAAPPTPPETHAPHPPQRAKTPKRVVISSQSQRPRQTSSKTDRGSTPYESELHFIRYRNTRSAPARPSSFYAADSKLKFLKKECLTLERNLKEAAQTNLKRRPKLAPYKPFTWNSLAPYYNTDTLRYLVEMPVTVRRGYNSRVTATGIVDPEISWKMDHTLTPKTPSRPELFRHHLPNRRVKSAMPAGRSSKVYTPKPPREAFAKKLPIINGDRPQ